MSMDKSMVLLKTVKGLDEIQNKVYGLAPKRRRVLIMVDGLRTVQALGSYDNLTISDPSLITGGAAAPSGDAAARGVPRALRRPPPR
mgnify:CR=1 FL=1